MTATGKPPYRVTPNAFGMPFGLCGLAQCWSTAHATTGIPRWPADTPWIISACVWLATLIWYAGNVLRAGRLRTELKDRALADPTFVQDHLDAILAANRAVQWFGLKTP
ncbi:hypothetical protein ACIA5D_13500 [Actinoplanes sp. NPDC051513]|uniref:hypothetical protein n=1 Tax=Actinoplanes sp. NPDC051513 TaxID=3363908 RepID=UPI003789C53C